MGLGAFKKKDSHIGVVLGLLCCIVLMLFIVCIMIWLFVLHLCFSSFCFFTILLRIEEKDDSVSVLPAVVVLVFSLNPGLASRMDLVVFFFGVVSVPVWTSFHEWPNKKMIDLICYLFGIECDFATS
ncbi:uncharacterized protein TM35_000701160 [Trypanosoma theileri]|uniref:Uncharacterized protein n=1 Tax=Trypanosoma theileri TaxID=67003 RepID=A0A1X0NFF4_9TRYP|nr:uncharacterized protein TM35_000701160 [Trypanosoma theileri]ORC83452.1 hypothetical protein TM35_000701160 [Trypanosoma theileri]